MRLLLAIISIALILSFLIYPSAFIYSHSTLPDNNDTRLIAYIISQAQDNFVQLRPLHYATYFAPYQNTLTYSEPFFLSALLTLPIRTFDTSPIFIANSAYILGFVLTFISSFYFFDYLFKNFFSALLATLLFNLSGFHLTYLPHLQMYSLWPVFLALLFFLRYCDTPRLSYFFLFFLSITAQMAESIFPIYLLFFTIILLPQTIRWVFALNTKYLLLVFTIFLPLWFYLLFPYIVLHHSFPEAVRPIRDAAHFSLGLEEIFTKFHSWTIIVLFIISNLCSQSVFFAAIFCKVRRAWTYILIFSLIMSLGPVLKFAGHTIKVFGLPIPLPYAAFYYLFPGFNGFRTPGRFIILTALAATIIIVIKLEPLFNKLKSTTKFLILISLVLILLLETKVPRPGYTVDPTPPTVYEQVKKLPQDRIILELPILLWNDPGHELESLRSLYSLEHGHRRLGGFSGFAPLAWIDLVEHLKTSGLDQINRATLKSLGITHLVENNTLTPLP
jgi:hypothetical protein